MFPQMHVWSQLLATVGIDTNDCIFPLAWAMVRNENKKKWVWFSTNIRVDFEIFKNPMEWIFIIDRQKVNSYTYFKYN